MGRFLIHDRWPKSGVGGSGERVRSESGPIPTRCRGAKNVLASQHSKGALAKNGQTHFQSVHRPKRPRQPATGGAAAALRSTHPPALRCRRPSRFSTKSRPSLRMSLAPTAHPRRHYSNCCKNRGACATPLSAAAGLRRVRPRRVAMAKRGPRWCCVPVRLFATFRRAASLASNAIVM